MPMTSANALLTIGEAARRAGLSVATLRYYEQRGLVAPTRTGGNQRRYPRWVLRQLAFIAAAQRIGLDLHQVKEALDTLPSDGPLHSTTGPVSPVPGANKSPTACLSCRPCRTPSTAASDAAACRSRVAPCLTQTTRPPPRARAPAGSARPRARANEAADAFGRGNRPS